LLDVTGRGFCLSQVTEYYIFADSEAAIVKKMLVVQEVRHLFSSPWVRFGVPEKQLILRAHCYS
jgi:hypothetical protein